MRDMSHCDDEVEVLDVRVIVLEKTEQVEDELDEKYLLFERHNNAYMCNDIIEGLETLNDIDEVGDDFEVLDVVALALELLVEMVVYDT